MEDKRKFVRFKATCRIQFSETDPSLDVSGTIKDISMGGARVSLDKPFEFPPNTVVSLTMVLPQNTLKISGEIVGQGDKKEVSIRFVRMPDAYKEEIYNYISKYHRKELMNKWWEF